MEYPKLEELNSSNCTERSIEIHYPEFWEYITKNYHCEKWTERLYWFYHNLTDYPKCKVCGQPTKFINIKTGYREFCGYKCMNSCKDIQARKKETSRKNWGTDNPMQCKKVKNKLKNTIRERYGVDSPFQSPDFENKRKATNLKKYGVEHHLQNPEIMGKQIMTNIERYGASHISQIESYKKIIKETCEKKYGGIGNQSEILFTKYKDTCWEKYGAKNSSNNDIIKDKIINSLRNRSQNNHIRLIGYTDDGLWKMKCPDENCNLCQDKYYITYSALERDRNNSRLDVCTYRSPINSKISNIENFIKDILLEYNINYKTNFIGLLDGRQELDIYIPSKKFAIECNGCYWHCSSYKSHNYHINKTKICRENNIELIHIWEDWVRNKPEIVKSIILNKLGLLKNEVIYARKCQIREVQSTTCNDFLEQNHIQGKSQSTIKYGLYYNDKLVSVMTFSKPRVNMGGKNHKYQWELVRFCSKLNTRVVGGASKLLNYFIKHYNPDSIISFSSNDISNGNLYKQLGFESDMKYQNSYWYIEPGSMKRYHRSSFTKSEIVKKGYKDIVDNTWTEKEIMEELGFFCIYDSGQFKWILDLTKGC